MRYMTRALALAAGLALGACALGVETPPDPPPPAVAGIEWVAEEIAFGPVVDRNASTLTIGADNRASGKAGCNGFGGMAHFEGGDRLTFGELASTRMFCAGVMEQELAYLKGLEEARRYRFEQEKLVLLNEGGSRLVVFRKKAG